MKAVLSILVCVVVLVGLYGAAGSEPFGYYYVGTSAWLPEADANVLNLLTAADGFVDLVTVYSASDMRLYLGLRGDESDATAAQAAADSLCGLVHIAPAAGQVYYGSPKWLFSPARTDTVYVGMYRQVSH